MSEYTPTTEEVRAEFIQNKGFRKPTDWDGYQEFDRWLAALIREAKAEALEEFAEAQETWCVRGRAEQVISRGAIRDALRARADEYREGNET